MSRSRLRRIALQKGEPMPTFDAPQQTHHAECWKYHPECALARIERLEACIGKIQRARYRSIATEDSSPRLYNGLMVDEALRQLEAE